MDVGVLLVDDESDIRLLMRALITAANQGLHVVGEAETGDEALVRVQSLDPEVIVLDQRMPGRTGIQTATEIHLTRPNQLIILCSAYLDESVRREAEAAGIKLCMTKTDAIHIVDAVHRVVDVAD